MQELLLVPARKLHPSRHLSLDQLALVETLSVGAHAVARAAPQKDESALVIGTGPIGLSVLVAARSAGARVLALEVSDRRIAFCRDALGVDACLKPGEGAADRIRDLLAGELPAVVFDCTGNPGSMTAAFGYVEHGGRLVFVGHFPGDITFHDPDFHKGELTLLATRNATAVEFGRVVLLLEEGAVDVRPWMTDCVALERVPEVFPGWLDRDVGALKPMIALG
jgi:threonine dehydrogenase-like Zn-dependent dehydrogenase